MKVSIVLVNWRGWRDTILCLQSVFRLAGDFRVIVCDNASDDDSLTMIRAWATGALCAWVPTGAPAREHAVPRLDGPVRMAELDAADAMGTASDAELVLLHAGANLGFAGGCNVGIRYAMARGDSGAIWLLNNDTVVDAGALEALLHESARHAPEALVSSRVMQMTAPNVPWFEGGEFRPLAGAARHVPTSHFRTSEHPFLSGCSLLIPRPALERVGLLDESFFMYGEDVDYCIRARELGIPISVAAGSRVLHAEAASTGHASASGYRNLVSSGLRLTRRHFGRAAIVTATVYHLAKLAYLAVVKRRSAAALAGYWRGIVHGLRA